MIMNKDFELLTTDVETFVVVVVLFGDGGRGSLILFYAYAYQVCVIINLISYRPI